MKLTGRTGEVRASAPAIAKKRSVHKIHTGIESCDREASSRAKTHFAGMVIKNPSSAKFYFGKVFSANLFTKMLSLALYGIIQ